MSSHSHTRERFQFSMFITFMFHHHNKDHIELGQSCDELEAVHGSLKHNACWENTTYVVRLGKETGERIRQVPMSVISYRHWGLMIRDPECPLLKMDKCSNDSYQDKLVKHLSHCQCVQSVTTGVWLHSALCPTHTCSM